MRTAFISDLHSNPEAITAVLEDIRSQGVDKITCLGDIVGYGPDPNEAIRLTRSVTRDIRRGNHDFSVLKQNLTGDAPFGYNHLAAEANRLNAAGLDHESIEFLRGLSPEPVMGDDGVSASVHGSFINFSYLQDFRGHDNIYVLPDRHETITGAARGLHENCPNALVGFVGHSHVTMVAKVLFDPEVEHQQIYQRGLSSLEVRRPTLFGKKFETIGLDLEDPGEGEKKVFLINPGSVGQPRDEDNRASYAIFDSGAGTVEFRRAEYDISAVQKRLIREEYPGYLVQRLQNGR